MAELWQQVLRQELAHRKVSREQFEYHERIIGRKVRQLRTERGWTQADLARRLDELGWPVDQTTVSNLELGRRPIRVAEADALALAFGVPMLAVWYLPVDGEPWSIAAMRRRLADIDEFISTLEGQLNQTISMLADQQFERIRVARAINEAAVAAESGDLEDLGLDAEGTRLLAEGLDPESHTRFIRSLPRDHPMARRHEPLGAINDKVPARLASEAFRMHQAGASPAEIGQFLARSVPAGVLDGVAAAARLVAEALGSTAPASEDAKTG